MAGCALVEKMGLFFFFIVRGLRKRSHIYFVLSKITVKNVKGNVDM